MAALISILVAAQIAWFVVPADAAGCGATQNEQVGLTTQTAFGGSNANFHPEGASTTITDEGGYILCTNDPNGGTNFSTDWAMFLGADGYVRSGNMYRWGYGSCVKRWAEQVPPGGTFADYYIGGCTLVGETNRFWEQSYWTGSSWVIRGNIDLTVIRQSTFSPYGYADPLAVAFSSEVWYAASDVAGSTASPERLTNDQVQNYTNDQWYTTCAQVYLAGFDQSARFGLNHTQCNEHYSWTIR